MERSKPKIAITMGDPAGVGPEICLHALARQELSAAADLVVYGDQDILDAAARQTGLPPAPPERVRSCQGMEPGAAFTPGVISAATGRAAYVYVDRAIRAAQAGEVDGVVTAPLNKEALHMAGEHFPGHTEIFAERFGVERFCMLQYSEVLSCSFVTVHVGYAEVPALITTDRIFEVIQLTREAFLGIREKEPRLVVLGLNPHAGEHGLFGQGEEETQILPAVHRAQELGWLVEGPIPPDTAFLQKRLAETDCFVCMYHDQGHIPIKALAFDLSVNTTLGLPVPRTSVDHGTALDIAWQGKANPSSLYQAVLLNAKLRR